MTGEMTPKLRAYTNLSGNTTGSNVVAGLPVFQGGNNITLSGTQNTILISGANQTNQTLGLFATGNTTENSSTTLDARSLSFNFHGAATGGFSNGSIEISAPLQTNQTGAIYASSQTTGQSSSSTFDARSLSIEGLGGVSVGWSNGTFQISGATGGAGGGVAISAGTQSDNTGTVVLSNSNGISFGMSNSSVITASYTVPTQSDQTIGLYMSGNTGGESSSSTIDARSFSVSGIGEITVGMSGGQLIISAPTDTQSNQTLGLYATGNTTQNSSTTLDARSLSFNFLGAISGGYSNGSIDLSVPTQGATGAFTAGMNTDGNTAGTTGGVSLSMEFVGGNNITLSQSINGQSATLSIVGGAGGGGATLSNYVWPPPQAMSQLQNVYNPSNFDLAIQYLPIVNDITVTRAVIIANIVAGTSATSTPNGASYTFRGGLYTLNASSLSLITSGSQSYTLSYSSNSSATAGGMKIFSIPLSTLLSPGEYYFLASCRSSTSGTRPAIIQYAGNLNSSGSLYSIAPWFSASNASYQLFTGMGVAGANSTITSLSNSIAVSKITSGAAGYAGNFIVQLGATSVWG